MIGRLPSFKAKSFTLSPGARVSLALAAYAVGILFFASLFGLYPDKQEYLLQNRINQSQSLASQLSLLISNKQLRLAEVTLKEFVDRNQEAIAAYIVTESDLILIKSGEIERRETAVSNINQKSSITHIKIPIHKEDLLWGTLHVEFKAFQQGGLRQQLFDSIYGLALFIALFCFFGFLFILKRTLRELNPKDVIPDRVQSAFNTLTEALVIVDEKKYILLANDAFSDKVNRSVESLIGVDISEFNWIFRSEDKVVYPWERTLKDGGIVTDIRMRLDYDESNSYLLSVNSSPVKDDKGKVRGALITFEDVSELVKQNTQLSKLIKLLRETEKEIKKKNITLSKLAKYDPLTNCYNRRTLFEIFDKLFLDSVENNKLLSCLMIDIDHFKLINDNHGHSVGDKAIKFTTEIIREKTRDSDLVGRYGGEEFCLVLPGITSEEAETMAERVRVAIQEKSTNELVPPGEITVSIGMCMLDSTLKSPSEMVDLADKALYHAKNTGRNRLVFWNTNDSQYHEKLQNEQGDDLNNTESNDPIEQSEDNGNDQSKSVTIKALTDQVEALGKNAAEKEKALHNHLNFDKVTRLPSRLAFIDDITEAVKSYNKFNRPGAVIVVNVNMFARISENLGENIGEILLKKLSKRLLYLTEIYAEKSSLNCNYSVAKIDSERFGILLSFSSGVDAETLIESVKFFVNNILTGLKKPVDIDPMQLYCTPEIGIALYPQNTLDPVELLRKAIIAKGYAVDDNYSKKIQFYNERKEEESCKQVRLEHELQLALQRGQLELHYQPCIDVKSGCIVSAEALIRWEHQEFGQIPAAYIIELAERVGFVKEISEWVFFNVCRQLKSWENSDIDSIRIFINLSAHDIQNKDIINTFSSILKKADVSVSNLGVEVTETALIQNVEMSAKVLNSLSKLGFQIALDDFGTGYSSLSYLQEFKLNILKIDRVFLNSIINEARSRKLYAAIISMAKEMDLITVAEGLENKKEMDVVSQLGVDRIQGHYFCKPMPAHLLGQVFKK